ncbi:hypothetical protein AG1IA_06208 [Rhizoctonia solani AG-1 IA]|uniref:Uncharacterized protein n=1 Tax=Thanatephorus cucumeris (strain AG1-IA) TaxID=983506 RepID=L8WSR3_THACA|nr:hypothetical protein AG1IA_06208 [Rhizoctonia solani AG-1 IA]
MLEESKLAHARESEMNAKRRAEEADERRRAQGGSSALTVYPQTLPWILPRAPHRCDQS